jgi:hypothetical protein
MLPIAGSSLQVSLERGYRTYGWDRAVHRLPLRPGSSPAELLRLPEVIDLGGEIVPPKRDTQ